MAKISDLDHLGIVSFYEINLVNECLLYELSCDYTAFDSTLLHLADLVFLLGKISYTTRG